MAITLKKLNGTIAVSNSFNTYNVAQEVLVPSKKVTEAFRPEDTVTPITSLPNTLCIATTSAATTVTLGATNFTIDAQGVITAPLTFNEIIEKTIGHTSQDVVVNGATTTIDLLLGQVINLDIGQNTVISFDNVPLNVFTPILIKIRYLADGVSPTFVLPIHFEGKVAPFYTSKNNAIDMLMMWLDDGSTLISRPVMEDFKVVTRTSKSLGTITHNAPRISYQLQPEGRDLTTISPNSIVSCNSNDTFQSTDVVVSPAGTFESHIQDRCRYSLMTFQTQDVAATATTTIDYDLGNVVLMTQDVDITNLTFTNTPATGITTFFIKRIKDATATTRDITFGANYKFQENPVLTQSSDAIDWLIIDVVAGPVYLLQIFNNFGTV